MRMISVPIEAIEMPLYSARALNGDDALLIDLIDNGLRDPLTVNEIPGGKYQVIDGVRRLHALRRIRTFVGSNFTVHCHLKG